MKTPPLPRNRLMGLLAAIVAAVALPSCVTTSPIGERVPVAAADDFRTSLRAADPLLVHEGLPHQAHEREIMQREAARKDVAWIQGYPYYTPAVRAKQPEALRRVLADPASYRPYGGPKTCGGFHPDYAVTWKSGGVTRHVAICFGCGEVLFSDGGPRLPYNLTDSALAELRAAFASHAAKRPPRG